MSNKRESTEGRADRTPHDTRGDAGVLEREAPSEMTLRMTALSANTTERKARASSKNVSSASTANISGKFP